MAQAILAILLASAMAATLVEGCCFDGERRPFHDKKGAILG
jgi:hypothetical protein